MDKFFLAFLNNICLKVNIIARVKFELAYYSVVVKHISHYTTWTHYRGLALMNLKWPLSKKKQYKAYWPNLNDN